MDKIDPGTHGNLLAYVTGLCLGDGNLSNPNGRAVRLRITCDARYPNLIEKIVRSVQLLQPRNKVSVFAHGKNCVNVSCYSNSWERLLGWQADGGSKFLQNVKVPPWVFESKSYMKHCLQGLIETDGTIYLDRGYPMIMFVTIIEGLAQQAMVMMQLLGYKPRLYKLIPKHSSTKRQVSYHVRLSSHVNKFFAEVKPEKI